MTTPVITADPIVDAVLERFSAALGSDAATYRHHVLRCLNYHALMAGQPVAEATVLAWAVHDLGIWTAATFDYLEPSAALLDQLAGDLGITDMTGARSLVLDHHSLRRLPDPESETFRRADLIDVSHGLIRFGISRANVHRVVAALPYLGFHRFLARGIARHASKNPTHPLPMLRW